MSRYIERKIFESEGFTKPEDLNSKHERKSIFEKRIKNKESFYQSLIIKKNLRWINKKYFFDKESFYEEMLENKKLNAINRTIIYHYDIMIK